MFSPTASVFRAAPVAGISGPLTRSGPPAGPAELIHSADVLSRVAESRPGGLVQGAELVDMAHNSQGQYRQDIQQAARVFLANGSGVHRAREAIRRRCANPHSACAGGRAYDFQDLQAMCHYLQQHPHGQQGDDDGQRRGAGPAFMPGLDAAHSGQAHQGWLSQMMAAVQQLAQEMQRMQRRHMSLERLMSMGHHGHPGAGFALGQPNLLAAIFNQHVHRNLAISLERLQQVGGVVDAHGNITSMGSGGPEIFEGPADLSAGRWWEPGTPAVQPVPASHSMPSAAWPLGSQAGFEPAAPFGSAPASPAMSPASPTTTTTITPPQTGATTAGDDQRRQDVLQQQVRREQVLQQERLRIERENRLRIQAEAVADDLRRNADIQAAQWRQDDIGRQQQMADDLAGQQRLADDIRADDIRAADLRADPN
ncbi:hypothetical protein GN316_04050 [Xylophilus sp. Kf1]|nr:hypothetical protein [Xylophilus sp. Kf1]